MPIELLPKNAPPTPSNITNINDGLTSVLAYAPLAVHTYTFYEVIDGWLGPWGEEGYPLGYGKRYDIAFNSNADINANLVASAWAKRVTVMLQESLRDFIVVRFGAGTLDYITEAELREKAFDSHSDVYTNAGLAELILEAPEILPVLAGVVAAEFNPLDRDFVPTVREVYEMFECAGPQALDIIESDEQQTLTGVLQRMRGRLERGELSGMDWTTSGAAVVEPVIEDIKSMAKFGKKLGARIPSWGGRFFK